jgi:hypothetical protein
MDKSDFSYISLNFLFMSKNLRYIVQKPPGVILRNILVN